MDPQLLRYIHRNAVSNACKYGKLGGTISTEINYDEKTQVLSIDIINLPGPHHDKLVEQGEIASRRVFESGKRLHTDLGENKGDASLEVSFSAGDGAWIMRKCARMLGGDVSITFNPHRTIFNLAIPAKPVAEEPSMELDFSIPPGTWGVILEDSSVQRKLLNRLLEFVGIPEEKRVILGSTAEEVLQFNDTMKTLIADNKHDKFVLIADENLDIVENNTHHRTLSGSLCIESLREDLNPDEESRLLAIVRSANDSKDDLDQYKKRAHGYLLKAPIRRETVLGLIHQLWIDRFPESTTAPDEEGASQSLIATGSSHSILSRRSSDSLAGPIEGQNNEENVCMNRPAITTDADLMQSVEAIDELLVHYAKSEANWPAIRDKYQVLKGDMMTLLNSNNPRVSAVLESLDELSSADSPPPAVVQRWKLMRALIVSLM